MKAILIPIILTSLAALAFTLFAVDTQTDPERALPTQRERGYCAINPKGKVNFEKRSISNSYSRGEAANPAENWPPGKIR